MYKITIKIEAVKCIECTSPKDEYILAFKGRYLDGYLYLYHVHSLLQKTIHYLHSLCTSGNSKLTSMSFVNIYIIFIIREESIGNIQIQNTLSSIHKVNIAEHFTFHKKFFEIG
jgi:hypothetical protein